MRWSLARVAFLLVAAAFVANSPVAAVAEEMAPGRIKIEYVPPTNPDQEALYYQLMERTSLEKIKAILAPFRLPQEIKIRTMGCGESNAWYQPVDGVPTITVCYEYLYEL